MKWNSLSEKSIHTLENTEYIHLRKLQYIIYNWF